MPTWRDTNPVPGNEPKPRVKTDSARGGVSPKKPLAPPQRRKMPWPLVVFIFIIVMGIRAGNELNYEQQWHYVTADKVRPDICLANGPINYIKEYDYEPGVYKVTCASGVTLTTGIYNP